MHFLLCKFCEICLISRCVHTWVTFDARFTFWNFNCCIFSPALGNGYFILLSRYLTCSLHRLHAKETVLVSKSVINQNICLLFPLICFSAWSLAAITALAWILKSLFMQAITLAVCMAVNCWTKKNPISYPASLMMALGKMQRNAEDCKTFCCPDTIMKFVRKHPKHFLWNQIL